MRMPQPRRRQRPSPPKGQAPPAEELLSLVTGVWGHCHMCGARTGLSMVRSRTPLSVSSTFCPTFERHHLEVPGTLFMSASRISPLAPGVRSFPRPRERRSPAPCGKRGEWQCRWWETSFPPVFISKPLLCSSQAKLFPLLSSLLLSAEEANPAYATGGVSGKVTVKEEPRPTRLSTATAPPWAWTTHSTMESPSPLLLLPPARLRAGSAR